MFKQRKMLVSKHQFVNKHKFLFYEPLFFVTFHAFDISKLNPFNKQKILVSVDIKYVLIHNVKEKNTQVHLLVCFNVLSMLSAVQVPQHYKLMRYRPVSAWEAFNNYTPTTLARPLRTGAPVNIQYLCLKGSQIT